MSTDAKNEGEFIQQTERKLVGTVHGGNWRMRDGYLRCESCGSLHPDEALRRMTDEGCGFSGTDKGAYKFYFESAPGTGKYDDGRDVTSDKTDYGKFYGEHLEDQSDEFLKRFSVRARRTIGFHFVREGMKLRNLRPHVGGFGGWQTYGKIGPNGTVLFDDGSPPAPDEQWWRNQDITID